ncbi:MAG TPA: 16S rRNA (uracil(1498)-N(3))-methyltransferase [Candidatus Avimonoglobus intestinipullorum]|uniref:Ribosomal RNA small subunit methyltransferase E n=1 Tax=Candidatus Avimonoglobus intestinipullorum TaxID=2840699 RepID=A0A9D1LUT8_9FIRM|nr:16S rRNA (uracil(1498)-N(3))-methyltransferase [Candidatus Avimonoglobus intestinipullorum]
MPKFFTTNIEGDRIVIDSEDVAHIKRVLRLDCGSRITVCDGKGVDYAAQIVEMGEGKIVCRVLERHAAQTEPELKVTLFQALPKAAKMEYIIQKTTELGISKIVPCVLRRCVVRLDGKKAEEKKTARWQKIAQEAAKQSGRGIVPEVAEPVSFAQALEMMQEADICFAPYECEEQTTLKQTLAAAEQPKTVSFMIGPEGGFDPEEAAQLKGCGVTTVTLGRRILRTETAGEAVLAMVMYELGDINASWESGITE